jgi:hypothetical protein
MSGLLPYPLPWLQVVRRQPTAPVTPPLMPSERCRHRHHGRSARIPVVTEFGVNSLHVATTDDDICLRWARSPETMDLIMWEVFQEDLLVEAKARLETRATQRPRKSIPPRRRRWAA